MNQLVSAKHNDALGKCDLLYNPLASVERSVNEIEEAECNFLYSAIPEYPISYVRVP
jgi:hypothetical protein